MDAPAVGSLEMEQRVFQFDYAALIRAVMRERRISANRLLKDNVIRKCSSRALDQRLSRGQITAAKLDALFGYLDIDPVRATLALFCLRDREAYFEPSCETASHLATDTVISLTEQIAGCEGNFEPITRSLCRELAQRTSGMILEHHRRVEQVRDSAFG